MPILDLLNTIIVEATAIAPEAAGNLNPPATAEELQRLKAEIPMIPSSLIELLSLHNGEEAISWMSLFPNGMQLMDIPYILENYEYQRSTKDEFVEDLEGSIAANLMTRPGGPVKPIFFYSKRIPFVQFNGELIWYVDLDPADGGNVGQIVFEDCECLELRVIATSLEALFEKYLIDLRNKVFEVDEVGQITCDGYWPDQVVSIKARAN